MASWMDSLIPSSGVNIANNPYGNLPGVSQDLQQGIAGLSQYNLGGQNLGQYQNLAQQGVNNPFAGQYQTGAGVAGQMGQQAGQGTFGYGTGLQGTAAGLTPDVQALIQMGFDPQQALYQRTQQQVQDQAAAQQAASGVGGTPYGAGISNQANRNFNIDWQNQQLARAATGAGAAGNLMGQIGAGEQAGANLQNTGINQYLQGSALPYNTYAGINQQQRDILNQAGAYGVQAAAIPQMQNQDWANYLQSGTQAQLGTQQQQMAKAQQEFQQAQQLGQDVGNIAAFGMSGGMSGMMPGGGPFGQSGGMGNMAQGYGNFGNFGGSGFGPGGGFPGYKPSAMYNPYYQGYQG